MNITAALLLCCYILSASGASTDLPLRITTKNITSSFRHNLTSHEALDVFLRRLLPRKITETTSLSMPVPVAKSFYASLTCFDMIKLAYSMIYDSSRDSKLSYHLNSKFMTDLGIKAKMEETLLFVKEHKISMFECEDTDLSMNCKPHLCHLRDTFWVLGCMSKSRCMTKSYFRASIFLQYVASNFMG